MKPQLLKVINKHEHSFSVRHDILPSFYNQLHYHEEVELVYIVRGSGNQFIGNSIDYFENDEMLLVGSSLPHLWRSDNKYLAGKAKKDCEAYVIHFKMDCFGAHFFNLPENTSILKLLEKAKRGIKVEGKTKNAVLLKIKQLLDASASCRIVLLLEVLQEIADSKTIRTICNKSIAFHFNTTDSERLNNVYQYLINNYSRKITLSEIAKLACLSPNAFCRYFKTRIRKSFSQFLVEIRIGHACKMLAETNDSILSIAYDCGYNNFTNFYRHFKNITKKTPLHYRKQFADTAH